MARFSCNIKVKDKQDQFLTGFKIAVRTGLQTRAFVLMVVKGCYGCYAIQSSNQQKLIKLKRLSKCYVFIFIEYLCSLNNKK